MSWVDHIEGFLPADDLRRAFVAGAQWCFSELEGATMFSSERRAAEDAAEERYPGGKPPAPTAHDGIEAQIMGTVTILSGLRSNIFGDDVYRTPDIVIATIADYTPDGVISAVVDNPPYVQTDSYEVIKEHHDG